MEEIAEVEAPQKIGKLAVGEETPKKTEKGSISRYEALFLRHRRNLSLKEAKVITQKSEGLPRYTEIGPSTKDISYLPEDDREVVENIRKRR